MPFAFSRLNSFGNSVTSTHYPFADQPPAEQDPFENQPPAGEDPFADQPQTGQDPFADEANSQQVPKLQPREIPAKPEETVDKPEQAAVTGSSDTSAATEQNSETGVPVVQAQRKLSPTSSFIPEFDYLYLLPLAIPVLLIWLWLRARKNQANKLKAYRQWQPPESLPTGLNIQRQPVWRPVQQKPLPEQTASDKAIVSDKHARFRTGNPSPEEIELSLEESGEELHIGNLSATDENDSEEFDFSAESDLELETETTPQAAHTGTNLGNVQPESTANPGLKTTASTNKSQFSGSIKERLNRSDARVAAHHSKNAVGQEGKRESKSVVTAAADSLQPSEPEFDKMFAENKEAIIATELDEEIANVDIHDSDDHLTNAPGEVAVGCQLEHLRSLADKFEREISRLNQSLLSASQFEQELDTVREQVTELNEKIRVTDETWTKRLADQEQLRQELEQRAVKAESRLADSVDKSVVVTLENKLSAIQSEFDAVHKQKESLAAKLAESESFVKLVESEATERFEKAQIALARAEEQAASKLVEAEEKATAQLTTAKTEYEARLADVESQATETLTKAEQAAADALAEAKKEAARKLAEVESQAAEKIAEAEQKAANSLAEAEATAKKLAQVESKTAAKITESENKLADQLVKAQAAAAKKLANVESQAAKKIALVEQDVGAQLANEQTEFAAKLAEIETQAAAKIAEAEDKIAKLLADYTPASDFEKVKAEAAAKISQVENTTSAKLAEAERHAEARIAEAESQVAAKVAKAEEKAADKLAKGQAKADARIAKVEAQVAEKLAKAEEQANAELAVAQSEADARIAKIESQAATKIVKAEEKAAANVAKAQSKADARIAAVEAQAEEKIAAAKAAAKQSKAQATAASISPGTGGAAPGNVDSGSLAKTLQLYKKERALRIATEKMLDEAEVHRSVLSKRIKDLRNQISSNTSGTD